ncbi:MAG: primase, partial [Microbacterium sp.]|nr:primase [Microbacterium sp.]
MTSTPESPDVSTSDEPMAAEAVTVDERLLAAHDLARAALAEITPASTIGDPVDYVIEADGVVSLRFANRLAGYPGWLWT